MKGFIFGVIHVIGLILFIFGIAFNQKIVDEYLFSDPEIASKVHTVCTCVGAVMFYLGYAIFLKEAWKDKDLKKFKILGF